MNARIAVPLIACALVLGRPAVGAAPDTVPAQVQSPQDSAAQGYAPAEPAPVPTTEPAPAGSPEPAAVPSAETAAPEPAAAPAAASEAGIRSAALRSLGFVEILTPRSADRIQQEIEAARTDQRQAEAEYDEQQGLEGQVKAMVDVKKQELSTLDAQRKLAEKNKQDAEVATFEAEKKDAERHKLFLEKRVSLHQAEKDAARARKNLAEATQKALELELQLSNRRAERDRAAATDAAAVMRHESVVRELERRVLEAQRLAAEREKQVADRHQDIAKRRLDLYQAQVAAGGNR